MLGSGAMCELVYLVAERSADPALLEATARAHRLHCDEVEDRKVGRALDHERIYATFQQCSSYCAMCCW